MKSPFWLTLLVVFAVLLTACSSQSTTQVVVSTPNPGNSNVVGQVISNQDGKPVVNTIIRLAEVYRQGDQGAYLLDEAFSPGTYSNDHGEFQILDISAGEYVLVIGEPNGAYEIVSGDDGNPKTWTALPDQTLDLGTVKVEYQVEK